MIRRAPWITEATARKVTRDPRVPLARSFLSGRPYIMGIPPAPPPPNRMIVRDGQSLMACPVRRCDFASPSGLLVTRHIQRQHLSRNEPGSTPFYRPFGGMPLTDTQAYRQRLQAYTVANKKALLKPRQVA
jgi:hypothetical protein